MHWHVECMPQTCPALPCDSGGDEPLVGDPWSSSLVMRSFQPMPRIFNRHLLSEASSFLSTILVALVVVY